MSEARNISVPERSASGLGLVRRSVWGYMALMCLAQLAAALIFFRGAHVLVYLGFAFPWSLLVGYLLAANVHLLYTPEGRPLAKLNLATRVTLVRVLAIPLVFMLIVEGRLETAGWVFLVAALTDWLDGFLARRMNEVTQLGRMVDPSIDAVICFFTFAALFTAKHVPLWLMILVSLRYVILMGGAISLKAALGHLPMRATFMGRLFYFIQYGFLFFYLVLSGNMPKPPFLAALALVQLVVSGQLLGLGTSLYKEHRS